MVNLLLLQQKAVRNYSDQQLKINQKTVTAIEKQLRKDLKVYDTPLYGGLNIFITKEAKQYLGD